ncbi:replication protein A 32 kDa subunit B isoform X2 [Apium graveolens]|uniref:replication protein A 32 kDa subunit B isoform X2 n=1 Tax=Apium graveolens TaxID=4045 RepID=UPI003D7A5714
MYGGQFDGSAAFAGGGFMPSQATQTVSDHSFSPAKNRETQQLLPLTVKQISLALSSDEKSNFSVDGVEINSVKLVGMVVNKAEGVTDVSLEIDDGTGRIDCTKWVNESADLKEMEGILDGMYVCVHGHLKGFQGKKQLVIFCIRPLKDFNEITYHFAECAYVHHYNTKLRGGGPAAGHLPTPGGSMPFQGYQAPPSNQFAGVNYNTGDLGGTNKMVLDFLQQPLCVAPETGVHQDVIARSLRIPQEAVVKALEVLVDEGLVYSSVDEFHYKSTMNG